MHKYILYAAEFVSKPTRYELAGYPQAHTQANPPALTLFRKTRLPVVP